MHLWSIIQLNTRIEAYFIRSGFERGLGGVAEWLGRRTLNQRVVGSNPGEGTARYLLAGYLKIHSSG
jgi:hypothetical protein